MITERQQAEIVSQTRDFWAAEVQTNRFREGLTWALVSSRLKVRYLPPGYILDSGSPCAFLRDGVNRDELWFILGWCLTIEASRILKTALNHTRNIQGKDVERTPYPYWVDPERKALAVGLVQMMLKDALCGRRFDANNPELTRLEALYALPA